MMVTGTERRASYTAPELRDDLLRGRANNRKVRIMIDHGDDIRLDLRDDLAVHTRQVIGARPARVTARDQWSKGTSLLLDVVLSYRLHRLVPPSWNSSVPNAGQWLGRSSRRM